MKLPRLVYLFTPILTFTMVYAAEIENEIDFEESMISIESEQFESASFFEEESRNEQETNDLSLAEKPVADIDALEDEALDEKEEAVAALNEIPLSDEAVPEVAFSDSLESDSLDVQAVPAAEKSAAQGGKGHAKDPRVNSDRPRVTHREAAEQKTNQTQVVQEDLLQENSSGIDDQAGLEENEQVHAPKQQVFLVPQEKKPANVVQEASPPKTHVQKKPQTVQPKPAQAPKSQGKPKQNSGTSSSRPLNRNSVYQEESLEEKTHSAEEVESKVLSFKGNPNRVIVISREKESQLIAADRTASEGMQRTVPAVKKKVQIQRENPMIEYKQRRIQAAAPAKQTRKQRTEAVVHQTARSQSASKGGIQNRQVSSTASKKTAPGKMTRASQSHATVYQDQATPRKAVPQQMQRQDPKHPSSQRTNTSSMSPGERAKQQQEGTQFTDKSYRLGRRPAK